MNKKLKILYVSIFCVLILAVLQTLPVFILKPMVAKQIKGKNIVVYYQNGDERGARQVYDNLENSAEEIRKKLKFNSSKPTNIYIYANQKSLWIRKYGFITILGAPNWFVGDNKKDKVIMISPYAKVSGYDNDSILRVATHELVHTINYQINPKLSYWNDNGVATFLAKQSPNKGFTKYNSIPTIDDMKSENEVYFGNIGGYQYSYTYIEFLNKQYGWDKVLDLITGKETYNKIFSKSEQEIYKEWIDYVKLNY